MQWMENAPRILALSSILLHIVLADVYINIGGIIIGGTIIGGTVRWVACPLAPYI